LKECSGILIITPDINFKFIVKLTIENRFEIFDLLFMLRSVKV